MSHTIILFLWYYNYWYFWICDDGSVIFIGTTTTGICRCDEKFLWDSSIKANCFDNFFCEANYLTFEAIKFVDSSFEANLNNSSCEANCFVSSIEANLNNDSSCEASGTTTTGLPVCWSGRYSREYSLELELVHSPRLAKNSVSTSANKPPYCRNII